MARKVRRAGHKNGSSWKKGNTVERRSTIGLGFLNVNGWSDITKDDVEKAMEGMDTDVFSFVETDSKKKAGARRTKIKLNGCHVIEVHREGEGDKQGGGIACAVKKAAGVVVTQHNPKICNPAFNYVSSERLWVKYKSDHGNSAICTVYLCFQADDQRHQEWNEGIYQVLSEEIHALRGDGFRVILQGDFNAWIGSSLEQGGIPGNRQKVTKNGELFLSFLSNNGLNHVNGAVRKQGDWDTRVCRGLWTRHASDYVSSSVLDYVVVAEEHLGSAVEMIVDQEGVHGGASDHNMLFSRWTDKFISVPELPPVKTPGWATDTADWDKFRNVVQGELDRRILGVNSLDSLSDSLSRILTKGLNIAVGRKSAAPPKQVLFPRHIVALIKERKELERRFKSEKSRFSSSRSQVPPLSLVVAKDELQFKTDELNQAKVKFQRQNRAPLLNLAKSKSPRNRRKFWEYVNRKTKKSSDIPPLQDRQSGVLIHDPQGISDEVHKYLKDIFSGSDEPLAPSPDVDVQDQEGPVRNDQEEIEEDDHEGVGEDVQEGAPLEDGDLDGAEVGGFDGYRDHEYSAHARSSLPKSGGGGNADQDPSGFLEKDFSSSEVMKIVKSLGNGKAAGHDYIINEALKEAPETFIRLLTKLFNLVKSRGRVPRSWNRGRVVLIHKKDSLSDIYNYRPLTVLPCMCATYSKVLNARLTEVVERHKLLGEVQNGFRKDRSCIDSAFTLDSVLWKTIAKRKKVNLAFLDLAKAYDSVCRETLWKKLEKMGFGGKFLEALKSLYKGDFVTCDANGVTSKPVYLRRGLRQGCSLSPILFALYVADMSKELHESDLGVKLYKVCISCLFFADDIVLVARDADGLRLLLNIVQHHCLELGMKLSVTKSKVMSSTQDVWELFSGDEVVGELDNVLQFKYLGIEMKLSPSKAAAVMMKRATSLANNYMKACLGIAYDGPDIVDLAMALWMNVAMPAVLYGCEVVPFTKGSIDEIERRQSSVGKFTLGLPANSPNISTTTILGVKSFKEVLYSAQLRYLVRLFKQDSRRWSKDAFLDHLEGGWASPYVKYMGEIRLEVGLSRWPHSCSEVSNALDYHFLQVNNEQIERLSLPALEPLPKRARMEHVDESENSQVLICNIFCLPLHLSNVPAEISS